MRQRMAEALEQVQARGYSQILLEGEGDMADVCRLTCLEHQVNVVPLPNGQEKLPRLAIRGLKVFVEWPEDGASNVDAQTSVE